MEEVDKQHHPVGDTDISFNLKDGFFEIYCLKYQRLLWMIIQDGFYQNKKPTEFRGIHPAGRFDATKPIDLARIGTNDSSMVGMEGVAVFLWSWNSRWADSFFFVCEGVLEKGISATLWILLSWLLLLVVLFSSWSAMIFAGVYSKYLMSFFKMSWSLSSKPVEIVHMKIGLVLVGTTQDI